MIALLTALIVVGVGIFSCQTVTPEIEPGFKKLAILPFKAVPNDPEMAYLGFSLANQIITKLFYVKSIVVRPPDAVRKYEHAEYVLPDVARELDVEFVVTGCYQKQADGLLLNAQVVNVRGNEVLWNAPLESLVPTSTSRFASFPFRVSFRKKSIASRREQ